MNFLKKLIDSFSFVETKSKSKTKNIPDEITPDFSLKPSANRSENNLLWQYHSRYRNEYLENGEIGLARNHLFEMAKIRFTEGDFIPALHLYFDVFYNDAIGFSNINQARLYASNPDSFKPSPCLSPAVYKQIIACQNKLGWSDNQLKRHLKNEALQYITEYPFGKYSPEQAIDILMACKKDGFDKTNDKL